MRPTVTLGSIAHAAARIVLLGCLIDLGQGPSTALAKDPSDSLYRILFQIDTTTPLRDGPHGDSNHAAIARISQVLTVWPQQSHLSFIFVAQRQAVCGGQRDCDPNQMLWQRTNAVIALMRSSAEQRSHRIPFDMIRQDFIEEVAKNYILPPVPEQTAALDLRIYVDARARASDGCPWQISLTDPALPPIVNAPAGTAKSMPLLNGQQMPIGAQARLHIGSRSGSEPSHAAVWETERGEFCKANVDAGDPALIVRGSVQSRIHLFNGKTSDVGTRRFLDQLTTTCALPTVVPSQIVAFREQSSTSKGIGDDPRTVPSGSVLPPSADLAHCQVTFVLLPTLGASSR